MSGQLIFAEDSQLIIYKPAGVIARVMAISRSKVTKKLLSPGLGIEPSRED